MPPTRAVIPTSILFAEPAVMPFSSGATVRSSDSRSFEPHLERLSRSEVAEFYVEPGPSARTWPRGHHIHLRRFPGGRLGTAGSARNVAGPPVWTCLRRGLSRRAPDVKEIGAEYGKRIHVPLSRTTRRQQHDEPDLGFA